MERNCHLIDLHKVIMAVILTAIKNQKNLHTLLDKPTTTRFPVSSILQAKVQSVIAIICTRLEISLTSNKTINPE